MSRRKMSPGGLLAGPWGYVMSSFVWRLAQASHPRFARTVRTKCAHDYQLLPVADFICFDHDNFRFSQSLRLCVLARDLLLVFSSVRFLFATLPPLVIGFSNDQERFDGLFYRLHFRGQFFQKDANTRDITCPTARMIRKTKT